MDGITFVKDRLHRDSAWEGNDKLTGIERPRLADRTVLLQDAAADVAGMDEDGAAILIDVLANGGDRDGDPLATMGGRDVVGGAVSVVDGKKGRGDAALSASADVLL